MHPGDRIINVGAGFAVDPTKIVNNLNGEILDACVKNDATLVAVDVDYKNLLTHKDLKELTDNKNLEMFQADAMNMPLGNESVSGIVSGNLINCPNPEMRLEEQAYRLAEEAWRLLRPGGFLLLSSFGYGLIEKDKQGRNLYNNDLRKEDFLTLKRLEKILSDRGFKDISELETDPHIERFLKEKTGALRVEEGGGFIAYKPRA
ncbi:MAG TPA: methyltransferase domain-containing protein [Candidatus Paceibacterota bacterium]|nr:methyltransferase domain-containing protein [Candidatus Paceibacterota bacterium]